MPWKKSNNKFYTVQIVTKDKKELQIFVSFFCRFEIKKNLFALDSMLAFNYDVIS